MASPARRSPLSASRSSAATLGVLLFVAGLALVASAPSGVFTIDEDNYLVTVLSLRHGALSLPSTRALPASPELLWFDPSPANRGIPRAPAASTAPPLYAPLALPFLLVGGWRGLLALNTLSYLVTSWLVFRIAAQHARQRATPWLAAGAFALGGYALEYAQGMWPHMVSVALSTGALACAFAARDRRSIWLAAASGLLIGWATGVRYQNVVFAAALGIAWVGRHRRQLWQLLAYGAGVGLPLLAVSFINARRLGTYNPLTKGSAYGGLHALAPHHSRWEPLHVFWAKVVDASATPRPGTGHAWSWPTSFGPFIWDSAIKKAWLQSCPWVAVALAFALLALSRRSRPEDPAHRVKTASLALIILAVLSLFAFAGFEYQEGLCYNGRYLLELTPLAALLLAWAFDGLRLAPGPVIVGGVLGALVALVALAGDPETALHSDLLRYAPLVLAAGLLSTWSAVKLLHFPERLATGLLAACLVWSFGVHLGDDLTASRHRRGLNAERAEQLAALPAGPGMLVVSGGDSAALGPLLLDHDLVLVDLSRDRSRDLPRVIAAGAAAGRRIFVASAEVPPSALTGVLGEWKRIPRSPAFAELVRN